MNSNRPSADVSFRLRLSVAIMITASNVCLLIALVSDHWINSNGRGGLNYLGLWKGCDDTFCYTQYGLAYSKAALIVCFILAIIFNVIAGLQFKYGFAEIVGFKRSLGIAMLIIGLVEFYGMTHATVFLVLSEFFDSVSSAMIFGWIAFVLAVAAGTVSYQHSKIDPEIEAPTPDIKAVPGAIPEPAFSNVDPPPYSITVS